jgi:hypothetical protein
MLCAPMCVAFPEMSTNWAAFPDPTAGYYDGRLRWVNGRFYRTERKVGLSQRMYAKATTAIPMT